MTRPLPGPDRSEFRIPSPNEIALSLDALAKPIAQYSWLVENVRSSNVAEDADFQRRFNAFWVVRKNAEWRNAFYSLFESVKADGIDYPTALHAMHERTSTVEASFSSKLVATLDPTKPVIDAFVLKFFGLRLPYYYMRDRIGRTIDIYREVERASHESSKATPCPSFVPRSRSGIPMHD